ncbi:hypothetical protein Pmani_038781 [Petrolisthes manimaculis]|uniref:Uncharacterized protein n=1 Tax=Petrolisthes manimaculis TaxID=1843537 RepID=A0AAE1NFF5_9EUCA|nr:hypothetical protein Pmani_038781 [Petrolisthes manimaculis]
MSRREKGRSEQLMVITRACVNGNCLTLPHIHATHDLTNQSKVYVPATGCRRQLLDGNEPALAFCLLLMLML